MPSSKSVLKRDLESGTMSLPPKASSGSNSSPTVEAKRARSFSKRFLERRPFFSVRRCPLRGI